MLVSHLQKVADDVVLEIVRFVGNVVRNDDCAQLFANAGLPNTLIELITAKQVLIVQIVQVLIVQIVFCRIHCSFPL